MRWLEAEDLGVVEEDLDQEEWWADRHLLLRAR